jgi:hypothetical protein
MRNDPSVAGRCVCALRAVWPCHQGPRRSSIGVGGGFLFAAKDAGGSLAPSLECLSGTVAAAGAASFEPAEPSLHLVYRCRRRALPPGSLW